MTPEEVLEPTEALSTSKDTTTTTKDQRSDTFQRNIRHFESSEDQTIIFNSEGCNETQLLEGMKHESNQITLHDVYDEVDASTVDDNVTREAMPTRWVHRKTGPGVRSRIVAFSTREDRGEDSVYAATPMFTTLRAKNLRAAG